MKYCVKQLQLGPGWLRVQSYLHTQKSLLLRSGLILVHDLVLDFQLPRMANLVRCEAKRCGHGTETMPPAQKRTKLYQIPAIGSRLMTSTPLILASSVVSSTLFFRRSSFVSRNTTTQDELDNACQAWLLV
jgi:hypothetical protein